MDNKELLVDFMLFLKEIDGIKCEELTDSEKDLIQLFIDGDY